MASMAFIKAICCISNEIVMDANAYMNCEIKLQNQINASKENCCL